MKIMKNKGKNEKDELLIKVREIIGDSSVNVRLLNSDGPYMRFGLVIDKAISHKKAMQVEEIVAKFHAIEFSPATDKTEEE